MTSILQNKNGIPKIRLRWVKEPHHSENVSAKKCWLYCGTRRNPSPGQGYTLSAVSTLVRDFLKNKIADHPLLFSFSSFFMCVSFFVSYILKPMNA